MNQETILHIAKYVGLGGLGLASFMLIARMALKVLPKPQRVVSTHFFRTVDKIILYAFLLSLLGLISYSILEFRKNARLQNDYDLLQQKLAKIQDPNLKMRGSAVEVLSCDVTFDFTNWTPVSDGDRLISRRSYELLTTKRKIWRAHAETTYFSATFGTDSPFEPLFDSSYLSKTERNYDEIQSGKDHLQRWILDYDISRVPVFTPFDIVTQIKAWNCCQNTLGHEGTLILYPTRAAVLTVLFPASHLPTPDSIKCFDFPLDKSRGPRPIDKPKLIVAQDRASVRWEIDEPRLNYHYIIEWKW